MKKIILFISSIISICFVISNMQCASGPDEVETTPVPVAEITPTPMEKVDPFDTSGIKTVVEVLSDGLSPNGDGFKDKIAFKISTGDTEKIKSWSLGMKHVSTGKINKEFKGTGGPPESMNWDGKENEEIVMQGKYIALLTLDYEGASKPIRAESDSFMLDITPPELSLDAKPLPFSPDGDGVNDEITISFSVNDASPIYKWNIEIFDEDGELFHTFSGAGDVRKDIVWDGKNEAGHYVEIASDYKIVLTVTDNCVNTNTIEKSIHVDVLIIKTADNRYKIKIGHIIFKEYASNFKEIEAEILQNNLVYFKQLSRLMKKYATYKILIEGHAMMPRGYLENKRAFNEYNEKTLIPLSKSRAEAVKKALVDLGVDGNRIFTEGIGASRPLYPHNDSKNRWQNRRVEFYLIRN